MKIDVPETMVSAASRPPGLVLAPTDDASRPAGLALAIPAIGGGVAWVQGGDVARGAAEGATLGAIIGSGAFVLGEEASVVTAACAAGIGTPIADVVGQALFDDQIVLSNQWGREMVLRGTVNVLGTLLTQGVGTAFNIGKLEALLGITGGQMFCI